MPWIYKDGTVLRLGRRWTDATGRIHSREWMDWCDEDKIAYGLTWEFTKDNDVLNAQAPTSITINASAAISTNLQIVFNDSWEANILKIYNVSSGTTMSMLTIPKDMKGSLVINIEGSVIGTSGSPGAANSGAGGAGGPAILVASAGVTVNVLGSLLGGGGGGGGGGQGGKGKNKINSYYGGIGGIGGRGSGYNTLTTKGSSGSSSGLNTGIGGNGGNGSNYGKAGTIGLPGANGNISNGNKGGAAGAAGRAIAFLGISPYNIIGTSENGIIAGDYT
jgi:hypothetical protein